MRSPAGASAAILRMAREGGVTLLLNVALALEYEAICSRPEHRLVAGLSQRQMDDFVNGTIALAKPVAIHYLWRPQLRGQMDWLRSTYGISVKRRRFMAWIFCCRGKRSGG